MQLTQERENHQLSQLRNQDLQVKLKQSEQVVVQLEYQLERSQREIENLKQKMVEKKQVRNAH